MSFPSRNVAAFIGLISLLWLALFGYSVVQWMPLYRQIELETLLLFGGFTVATAVALCYPIKFSAQIKLDVTSSILFTAILLVGMPGAMLVAALGILIGNSLLKRSWYNVLFNMAMISLCTGIAGLVCYSIAGPSIPFVLKSLQNLWLVPLSALSYYLCNTFLLSLIVGLTRRMQPFYIWRTNVRTDMLQESALLLFGSLAGLVGHEYPLALVLFVLPVGIVYLSWRKTLQLQLQTREAIEHMADMVDLRDPYTAAHSQRVAGYAAQLARQLRLPPEEVEVIYLAGRVHDLGKMMVSLDTLLKNGPMGAEERREMNAHPQTGALIVGKFSEYKEGVEYVRSHHERYDGSGYPHGLKGEAIPFGARILAVADAFDAMTMDRPYRKAFPVEEALKEIERQAGQQFDPKVALAFVKLMRAEQQHSGQSLVPNLARM